MFPFDGIQTFDAEPTLFEFLDPGPLIDSELELVAPEPRHLDDLLDACQHPQTRAADLEHAEVTRAQLRRFLQTAPGGHEPPDPLHNRAPAYHFWMRLRPPGACPLVMAGTISMRVGYDTDVEQYYGHVGYNVYPAARGRHYAERACRLLLPLAQRHGLSPLWITTDPENTASRRTCERLGARLINTVDVPWDHPLYARGQKRKCRYRLDL